MTRDRSSAADQSSGFVIGLACGAILGAALGMLFAPQPGARSRTWIAERGRTAARRVRISGQEATDIVRQKGVRGLFAVLRDAASSSSRPAEPDAT
jgi:gas vesicle protein